MIDNTRRVMMKYMALLGISTVITVPLYSKTQRRKDYIQAKQNQRNSNFFNGFTDNW